MATLVGHESHGSTPPATTVQSAKHLRTGCTRTDCPTMRRCTSRWVVVVAVVFVLPRYAAVHAHSKPTAHVYIHLFLLRPPITSSVHVHEERLYSRGDGESSCGAVALSSVDRRVQLLRGGRDGLCGRLPKRDRAMAWSPYGRSFFFLCCIGRVGEATRRSRCSIEQKFYGQLVFQATFRAHSGTSNGLLVEKKINKCRVLSALPRWVCIVLVRNCETILMSWCITNAQPSCTDKRAKLHFYLFTWLVARVMIDSQSQAVEWDSGFAKRLHFCYFTNQLQREMVDVGTQVFFIIPFLPR